MRYKQSGSTLIKIAITMAIISLIFTLTVKGRELVENARAESLARDFRGIQTALHTYQDRFNAPLLGDSKPSSQLQVSPPAASNSDQRIDVKLNSALGGSYFLWQHVKLTAPLNGAVNRAVSGYVPFTGGTWGVNNISAAPISGMSGDYIICSENIPGRLVLQLDMMMDDGDTTTGSMLSGRATYDGEPIPGNSIIGSDSYLTCLES